MTILERARNAPLEARPNIFHNADFSINQRSILSNHSTSGWTVDRWFMQLSGATGIFRYVEQDFTSHPFESRYYAGIKTTVGNDNAAMHTRIENPNRFYKKPLTFSCWMYNTGLIPYAQFQVYSPTSGYNNVLYRVQLDSSHGLTQSAWSYVTVTCDASLTDFDRSQLLEEDAQLRFVVGQGPVTSSGAMTLYLADVKLEIGYDASPFEVPEPAIELAKCQRYFYKWSDVEGTSGEYYIPAPDGDSTTRYGFIPLPTTMRVAPSCTGNVSNGSPVWLSSTDIARVNISGVAVNSLTYLESGTFEADAEL